MPCYIAYYMGVPASVVCMMQDDAPEVCGYPAMFFLGTLEGFQRKGIAEALAARAIDDAFNAGAKLIICIAQPMGIKLAYKLGFKQYDYDESEAPQ